MGIWKRIFGRFFRVRVEKTLCFRCPICSPIQFIEYIEWIPHLVDNHRRETLAREFPDVDLIYYLAGKNPSYGNRPIEEIQGRDMERYVGTKIYKEEMSR